MNAHDSFLKRVRDLLTMTLSDNPHQSDIAKRKLRELLKKHNKTENDMPALLAEYAVMEAAREAAKKAAKNPQPPPDPRTAGPDPYTNTTVTPADTVRVMLEDFVALDPHEYVAVALWIIHTHVFDRFMFTPRLLLTSPVRNCGKTTLLDVLSSLVARPHRSGNITAAVLYHCVNRSRSTMLLDECDNLDLEARKTLLGVLNDGYRKGGSSDRLIKNEPVKFAVFAPVALAGIGTLPLPLMSRCVVIRMRRHDGSRPLKRFDRADVEVNENLDAVYRHIFHWLAGAQLDHDPAMPPELRGRVADNWRPLISIADACSEAWGEIARAAAVKFASLYQDEDIGVTLLHHLHAIYAASPGDWLASKVLVASLIEHDEMWMEWRGVRGDERPRKLTQGALADLLRPFGIKPRKFWITRDPPVTARGYLRADLEAAWTAYCSEPGTPGTQSKRYLRSVPLE